ncbi:MAG: D-alanyl-D-alanine carboxypeptidase/D-alanyl-D-alanine-endopeptidase [Bacteroidota bacterium]|nr:D-alanyl-D-alanine carboxypeptidase/D-alanyl-D-alanine-endopeptidase [Bacteroidota bacterium]
MKLSASLRVKAFRLALSASHSGASLHTEIPDPTAGAENVELTIIPMKKTIPVKPVLHIVLIAVLLCFRHIPVDAQDTARLERLQRAVDKELSTPLFRKVIAAVEISEAETGRILYAHNSRVLLRPASNAKLFATAAALWTLPSDFRFRTELAFDESSSGAPALWVIGGGDPLLSTKDVERLATAVSETGIPTISAICLDLTAFDSVLYNPAWMLEDVGEDYCTPVTALSFERNVSPVRLRGGTRQGERVSVDTDSCRGSDILVDAVTGRGVEARVIPCRAIDVREENRTNRPGRPYHRITGSVPAGTLKTVTVATWDPPAHAACTLASALRAFGIETPDRPAATGKVPIRRRSIAAVERGLDEVLAAVNRSSDNLAAECLLKTIGLAVEGLGSWACGLLAMASCFHRMGIDTASIRLVDGSGLSHGNLVSVSAIGSLLRTMYRSSAAKRFIASLAQPGSGTMMSRLKNVEGADYVHAKTGTLNGVSSLSGYVLPPQGVPLVFSITMQNFAGDHAPFRAVQDNIVGHCLRYSLSAGR